MRGTTDLYKSDALTVLDTSSRVRKDFLKKWFRNSIDGIRFYRFLGQLSQIPLLGSFLKKGFHLYYRYLHTNSLILPLKDIEEIIGHSTDIYVDPCGCRLAMGEKACETPLFVCMRINTSAKVRKEQKGSKGLSKENAVAIMRNARKLGMVFSLESCIQPYQYNICTCCACCCIGMQMRYQWGIDVYQSGPYAPRVERDSCSSCGLCVEKCPVSALTLRDTGISVDLRRCLGCGICSAVCPEDSISMAIDKGRIRNDEEPSALIVALSLLYIYIVMIPSVIVYRLISGSMREKAEAAKPNHNDLYKEYMQQ